MCQRRHVAHVFRCAPGNRSADNYCLQLEHYLVPSSLTCIRGGLDRSTRRRSVVPRLVSFSFSRARPHRHLFRRRSRARVQRSLCFKRERHRHRSRAARFVDVVVVLCARDSSSHRRGEKNRTSLLSEMTVGDDKKRRREVILSFTSRALSTARATLSEDA